MHMHGHTYHPPLPQALQRFTLKMAQQGHMVSAPLMQGDLSYAHEKLALAHTSGDAGLRELAVDLLESLPH